MSQINSQSVQLTFEPVSKMESGRVAPKAMPEARRDFDAALRRASHDDDDSEDHHSDQSDQPDQMPPNMTAFGMMAPMQSGAMAAQVTSAGQALGGGAASALPNTHSGTLPDAAPMKIGVTSADQQWRINIPGHDPSSSALAARLVSAGTGHWQLRLAADSHTRMQLTPKLGRLRDKLRQHSGGNINDLGFDDDSGPEPDA